mmetsp:Transcript_7500/g.46115  ORF Transcript_7500/g.46115 Transcript_7500/m.46115 type:complete len:284 (+) Transcript_7500:114-965(+)
MGTHATWCELRRRVSQFPSSYDVERKEEEKGERTWMVPVSVDVEHPGQEALHDTFLSRVGDGCTRAERVQRILAETKLPVAAAKTVDDSLEAWLPSGTTQACAKSQRRRLAVLQVRVPVEPHVLVDDVLWNVEDETCLPENYASALVQDLRIPAHYYAPVVQAVREQRERVRRGDVPEKRKIADAKWELPRLLTSEEYEAFLIEEKDRDNTSNASEPSKRKRYGMETEDDPGDEGQPSKRSKEDEVHTGLVKCTLEAVQSNRIICRIEARTQVEVTQQDGEKR